MELKAIGAVSSAKVLGVFYTAIGLIAGVIVAAIGLTGAVLGHASEGMNPMLERPVQRRRHRGPAGALWRARVPWAG